MYKPYNYFINGGYFMNNVKFCIGGAEKEAAELKSKIQNAENLLSKGRVVYYVSNNGDDSNNGTSPDSPFKTIHKVNQLLLRSGDVILFERNSVFRMDEALHLYGGVSYGAYGEGEKPLMLGSVRDYADASVWKATESPAIWVIDLPLDEAGMVNFNNDTSIGWRRFGMEELKADGDYFHDLENGVLYLYCSEGNPGKIFNNIEIATMSELFYGLNVNHITVDNISFKYTTFGPFLFGNNKEINITNCEIGWVGGKVYTKNHDGYIRYGNAIQFWYRAYDISVTNCYIYQIFDAALTFQGCGDDRAEFVDITFKDNLIEYCSMNIEYWAGQKGESFDPMLKDIYINNNIIRFGGYGWGGIQRPDQFDQALILGWNRHYNDMENFNINDNILDCADCCIIFQISPKEQNGLNVYGNTYYQKKTTGSHQHVDAVRSENKIFPRNQADFEKAIAQFEDAPKSVIWLAE